MIVRIVYWTIVLLSLACTIWLLYRGAWLEAGFQGGLTLMIWHLMVMDKKVHG